MKKEEVKLDQVSGVMVGFVPNLRRPFFQDRRVRQALNYAFDFETLNKTIFYGQYQRINSFFFGLPLAASGLPTGKELEILNTVKDEVPPEVFTKPYENPVGGDPQKVRENLRQAFELLSQAGYTLKGNQLVGKDGKPVVDRAPAQRPDHRARGAALPAGAGAHRHHAQHPPGRFQPVHHPPALARLRHGLYRLGREQFARQRAARLLGLEGGRQRGLAELCRHQGPGGRHDHQRHHLSPRTATTRWRRCMRSTA